MKGGIGIISLLIGVAGMDSENLTIPIILSIIGLILLAIEGRRIEKNGKHDYSNHTCDYPCYFRNR